MEKKWRALASHWPGYVITLDREDRFTSLNRDTKFVSAARDLGRSVFDFVSAPEQARLRAQLAVIRAGGETVTRRSSTQLPDGKSRWYDTRIFLLDDEGGVMLLIDDVTAEEETKKRTDDEREQAATALRLSEERYRLLFDESPVSMLLFDARTFQILGANAAASRQYGYTNEELLARSILDLKVPEEIPALRRDIVIRQPGDTSAPVSFRGTRKHRTKSGAILDVEIVAHTLELEGRQVQLSTGIDVTETRRLEAQLRQAQKMEAVGQLAGGIAHDFNNILSVILSCGELLQEDLGAHHPALGDVAEICQAGHRAAQLTRQLLAFSRQQSLEPRVLDLNELLAGMDRMLLRLLGEDVSVEYLHPPGLGRVKADPGSVEQVVMNLAVNARDAMPSGGKLTIETTNVVLGESETRGHPGMLPGRYVSLRVSDNGTGMDSATREHIFEPFFTTKEAGKGTGLGLSMVFGIVNQSGGSVSVESTPGKGTTFEIRLPRVDADTDTPRTSDAPSTLNGKETILLVEDEAPVRAVARSILQRHGYRILEASSAGEALLHCEQHDGEIHLLLSDVVMPQMRGPDLAKRLLRERGNMRVLCMSGYTGGPLDVVDKGFAFLKKPFTAQSLARKVRDVLDEKKPVGTTAK